MLAQLELQLFFELIDSLFVSEEILGLETTHCLKREFDKFRRGLRILPLKQQTLINFLKINSLHITF